MMTMTSSSSLGQTVMLNAPPISTQSTSTLTVCTNAEPNVTTTTASLSSSNKGGGGGGGCGTTDLTTTALSTQTVTSGGVNNSGQVATPQAPKQMFNNSSLKLIQRLLEETSQTGDLILSGRNLTEFPAKLALVYDLTDTLYADLSKNHLSEFPKELCQYDSLEKLSLYSNLIRIIPDITPYQLRCLKILDLNSNNLSYLPPCLCNLASLEVLTVNNNKLVSLPEEIGRLDKLIQLDVSCNEITHLPVQIGDMARLRALNVRRNYLVELPKEIAQLKLVSFDCSSNRLSKLPLCFREMVTLIDLVVDHNPLEVPPAHICTKGLLHIMKYLLVEAIKEEKKRGILTEYEINTQYNNFNYAVNAHHQRMSSCTTPNYAFSTSTSLVNNHNHHHNHTSSNSAANCSSVRKKSSTSSTASSHSSTSSSSVASSNSLSSSSTTTTTQKQSNNPAQADTDPILGDVFADAGTNLSTSSSSSPSSCCTTTSSSSTSSLKTQKIVAHDSLNAKLVSIHELISNSNINSNCSSNSSNKLGVNGSTTTSVEAFATMTPLQQQQHYNYLKLNRANMMLNQQDGIDFEQQERLLWQQQQQTPIPKCKPKQFNHHQHVHHYQQLDSNMSLLTGLSASSNLTPNGSKINTATIFSSSSSTTKKLLNTSSSDDLSMQQQQQQQLNRNLYTTTTTTTNTTPAIKSPNVLTSTSSNLCNSTSSSTSSSSSSSASTVNSNQNTLKGLICSEDIDEIDDGCHSFEHHNHNQQPSSSLNAHIIYEEPDNPSMNNGYLEDQNIDDIPVHMVENEPTLIDDCTTPTNNLSLKYYNLPSPDSHHHNQQQQQQMLSPNHHNYHQQQQQQHQHHYQHNQQQQQPHQQIWIPRGEMESLTLSNGKDLPPDLHNINPAFTIRRHIIQIQEEHKQIETLKKTIEVKLKIQMPPAANVDEVGVALSDGVVLCHLINQIFPRAVQIIHVPSLAMPKLSLAKCRKNVENFIDACRRLGLPENDICCAHDIIEAKNTAKVARTIIMLVNYNQLLQQQPDIYGRNGNNSSAITTIGNAMSHPTSIPQASQQQQQQQTAV